MNSRPHIRLKPGDIADTILLPGDPARLERIIRCWDRAELVASNREFTTYTGLYKGSPVSACSTGIGSPSAAIAVEELIDVGARTFIRVGTCGGLRSKMRIGDLVIPYAAIRDEGTTPEYVPVTFPAVADPDVFARLTTTAVSLRYIHFTGVNRTHDAFYEPAANLARLGESLRARRGRPGYRLVSSEMECSAVFVTAMIGGARAGAILAVNTLESLDAGAADLQDSMYELSDEPQVLRGIDNAIHVALEAALALQEEDAKAVS